MNPTEIKRTGMGEAMRLLGDPTRLRMLALLEREELAVGELSRALGMAQSRVSNHLRLIRSAGLLIERKVGTSTLVRLETNPEPSGLAERLWQVLRPDVDLLPEHGADCTRLAAVLEARRADSGEFFDRIAGQWDKLSGAFDTGQARARAALQLMPAGYKVADLGCGTGYMAEALLNVVEHLVCVDRSEQMLEEAKARLVPQARSTQLDFRSGDLDALPIADQELDGLVCGMVLHHLENLDSTAREMFRVLKPGASATLLELSPHHAESMRTQHGDRHLGLPPTDVLEAMERAGFRDTLIDPADDHYRPRLAEDDSSSRPLSLSLYVVRARRPALQTEN